ncbi:MAG: ABC transporter permease [Acidimicrobiales bacterium]
MTAFTVPVPPRSGPASESPLARAIWAGRNVEVLTRRSLARIKREPELLSQVTVQPIMFLLLFTYVFGSAIHVGGGSYHEYLVGGMFGTGLAGTAPGTAVALTKDMSTGLIDRFRSLPMSRSAVLAGRTLADLATQVLALVVTAAVGLAIGWRVHTGPADVIAALALTLLFGYAMSWAGAALGMALRSPEAAQQVGFVAFLPLLFVSNAFVPTQGFPPGLRTIANWNPISAVAAAARHLFGNPNPAGQIHSWPMQHPELAVVAWSVGMIVVFAPLAVRMYRRKA